MLTARKLIRLWGVGGSLGGGLAGSLFLVYPALFPPESTLDDVVLVTTLLGAAVSQLLFIVIVRPFSYYFSLLQLYLVRQLIGEQSRAEITRELTFGYFLGDSNSRTREVFSKVGKKSGENTVQLSEGAVGGGADGAARGDGSAAY